MKKNVLDGFKAISSMVKNFQNWPKKNLRGDHRTKGGTIGKKFFQNMSLSVQNDSFDEKKRFGWFQSNFKHGEKFLKLAEKKFKG